MSHGGAYVELKTNEDNKLEVLYSQAPSCQHEHDEEADTLLAFYTRKISDGNILVKSSDTDVFIILLGLCGWSTEMNIILDYGSSNIRRYIDVPNVAAVQENVAPGSTKALIGLHALTGSYYIVFLQKG